MERTYFNHFSRIGVSDAEAQERVKRCFDTLFFDPEERIYQDVDADSGCMVDTGNIDARTEGMSYGMMMCVQMDRKDLFDRLWQFAMRYMYHADGIYKGYFAWSVQLDGKHNAEGPAPDGRNTLPWRFSWLPPAGVMERAFSRMPPRPEKYCGTALISRKSSPAGGPCGMNAII